MALFNRKRKKVFEPEEDAFALFESVEERKRQRIEEQLNNIEAVSTPNSKTMINNNSIEVSIDLETATTSFQNTAQIPGCADYNTAFKDNTFGSLVGNSIVLGKRSSQQDAIATSNPDIKDCFKEKWIGVLCDGMGGMNGGERASAISVRIAIETFRNSVSLGDFSVPDFYRSLIEKMDYEVSSLEDAEGRYLGAGTTFVSVVIDNGQLYWASVGDSHIYIIRDDQIKMIVREHNYFMDLLDMVKAGEITYEEACKDKSKEALTSYIGIGGITLMDVTDKPVNLIPGDIILLCSDGLYRSVTDQEILNIIHSKSEDMNLAAEALTQFAIMKNNPYQDNTSVVIARYK